MFPDSDEEFEIDSHPQTITIHEEDYDEEFTGLLDSKGEMIFRQVKQGFIGFFELKER